MFSVTIRLAQTLTFILQSMETAFYTALRGGAVLLLMGVLKQSFYTVVYEAVYLAVWENSNADYS